MASKLGLSAFTVVLIAVGVVVDVAQAKEYAVGDSDGWRLNSSYSEWAQGKPFAVGDKLVFKYNPQYHDVIKVSSAAFQACKSSSSDVTLKTGNDVVTLTTPGRVWYICGFPGHCDLGQKLTIDVGAASGQAPAPSPSSTGSSPAPSPPSVVPAEQYTVGEGDGWGLKANYTVWAQGKRFFVGDKLVFNYNPQYHDVIKVSSADFQACKSSPSDVTYKTGKDVITLTTPGNVWYICGFPNHCALGQKLAINVLPASGEGPTISPSTTATPPTPGGAPKAGYPAMVVTVFAAVLIFFIK